MICCVQVSSFALSSLSLKGWVCECECPPRRCWPFRCLPGCPRSDVTPVHPLFRNAYNNGRSRSGYNRKGIRPWNAVSLLSPINRNYSIKKKSEVHPVPLKIYIPKWYVWSKQKIQPNAGKAGKAGQLFPPLFFQPFCSTDHYFLKTQERYQS